jgi:hypothetical protein
LGQGNDFTFVNAAVKEQAYNENIQMHRCEILSSLAATNDDDDDYRNRIFAKDLSAVVDARRVHKDNEHMLFKAEEAIRTIVYSGFRNATG